MSYHFSTIISSPLLQFSDWWNASTPRNFTIKPEQQFELIIPPFKECPNAQNCQFIYIANIEHLFPINSKYPLLPLYENWKSPQIQTPIKCIGVQPLLLHLTLPTIGCKGVELSLKECNRSMLDYLVPVHHVLAGFGYQEFIKRPIIHPHIFMLFGCSSSFGCLWRSEYKVSVSIKM